MKKIITILFLTLVSCSFVFGQEKTCPNFINPIAGESNSGVGFVNTGKLRLRWASADDRNLTARVGMGFTNPQIIAIQLDGTTKKNGGNITETVNLDIAALAADGETENFSFPTGGGGGNSFSIEEKIGLTNSRFTGQLTFTYAEGPNLVCEVEDGIVTLQFLPVELISFEAKPSRNNKQSCLLEWSTATELNNSHFEVEHSVDGRNFTMLGKVDGMGTTSEKQFYSFSHENAPAGKNYYRLRQLDFDGAHDYSWVEVVDVQSETGVTINPTIVRDRISVALSKENATDLPYQIIDVAGRNLQSAIIPIGSTNHEINVSNLNSGFYYIQMSVNGVLSSTKFIKL